MRRAVFPAVVALLAVLLIGATAWATADQIGTCVDGVGFGYCTDGEKQYAWNAAVAVVTVGGALAVLASIAWQRRRAR